MDIRQIASAMSSTRVPHVSTHSSRIIIFRTEAGRFRLAQLPLDGSGELPIGIFAGEDVRLTYQLRAREVALFVIDSEAATSF